MKFLLFLMAVFVAVFSTACEPRLSSFDEDVNALIRKQCEPHAQCEIRLRDATSFDWDEMYVFRPGIVDLEARHFVPVATEFRGEFNRKIVFLKDGKLVRIDEAPSVI